MKPDATRRNPDPTYLRSLVERSGLSQVACARRLDLDPATLRRYLMPASAASRLDAPYAVQYALEGLARS